MFFRRIIKAIFYRVETFPRRLLCALFGIKGGFHYTRARNKKYVSCVIKHLNGRKNRGSVLEIGCGLGDILRELDFTQRKGLDKNENILSAFRFIDRFSQKTSIMLEKFVLGDELLGRFDAIILCNWIHNIEPELLQKILQGFYSKNLKKNGEIIIDVIISESDAYKFKHDPSFLKPQFSELSKLGEFPNDNMSQLGIREVYSFEKTTEHP